MRVRKRAVKFIRKRQWDRLRKLLHSLGKSQETTVGDEDSSSNSCVATALTRADVRVIDHDLRDVDKKKCTILHVLVAHRPPLDLVKRVHWLFPSMVAAVDSSLATPLHTAIASDAPHDVIKFLVEARPEAPFRRDGQGKTPIIIACEEIGCCVAAWADHRDTPFEAVYEDSRYLKQAEELVRGLALSCPGSVVTEDNEGLIALDHAIRAKAPKDTIRMLEEITAKMGRKVEVTDREDRRRRDVKRTEKGKGRKVRSIVVAVGA